MMYKIFTFLSGLCALISATAFFVALVFCNTTEFGVLLIKTSLFCFAMTFVFGLGSVYHDTEVG